MHRAYADLHKQHTELTETCVTLRFEAEDLRVELSAARGQAEQARVDLADLRAHVRAMPADVGLEVAALRAARSTAAQAEATLATNLEVKRRVLGERHTDTCCAAANLAALWAERGARLDEAVALAARTAAVLQAELGAEHPTARPQAEQWPPLWSSCRPLACVLHARSRPRRPRAASAAGGTPWKAAGSRLGSCSVGRPAQTALAHH